MNILIGAIFDIAAIYLISHLNHSYKIIKKQ